MLLVVLYLSAANSNRVCFAIDAFFLLIVSSCYQDPGLGVCIDYRADCVKNCYTEKRINSILFNFFKGNC